MAKNLNTMKFSEEFHKFICKFGANRVIADMEDSALPLCILPDLLVKYFKTNNNRYLELIEMSWEEYKDGA